MSDQIMPRIETSRSSRMFSAEYWLVMPRSLMKALM